MVRDEVSSDTVEEVTSEFSQFFAAKMKKKGMGSFSSRKECLGAIYEEMVEVTEEIHSKNDKKATIEMFDLAIACLFSVMSLRTIKNG